MSKEALLVGRECSLMLNLPHLLDRAGFVVDVLCSNHYMRLSRFVRKVTEIEKSASLIPKLIKCQNYDWIIITDDQSLKEILDSSLSDEEKIRLLPILRSENLAHLCSKIGLSNSLQAHNIPTPPFAVASHKLEAKLAASHLGYPILIKKDVSSGGGGIYECCSDSQLEKLSFHEPLLLQKKIGGMEIMLSSLFLEGQLIHFSYATPVRLAGHRFGVSSLQTYYPSYQVENKLFKYLDRLGEALGLHGFANIACIKQQNGEYLFFEADVRPTVWVALSACLGEDPAAHIRSWFFEGKAASQLAHFKSVTLPYFLRIKVWEFLLNRFGVWRTLPKGEGALVRAIMTDLYREKIRVTLKGKKVTPKAGQ